ncbi:MAG: peptidoglycan DD-metalloendopeptidase family protein [Betaproteobacteria bacterium]|nr:peptidoglycan DD-metalloendopeptidase family protein [Betaproteobacteria bacterium]
MSSGVRDLLRLSVAATLCAMLMAAAGGATAAPPANERKSAEEQAKRGEMRDLKERIESLRKEVSQAEETRNDARERLRESERAISGANRALRELGAAQRSAEGELAQLEAHTRRLETRIGGEQERLGRMLARQYRAGQTDTLRQLLGGDDPNQVARDAHYMGSISRARASLIDDLRHSLAEKSRLAGQVQHKTHELADLEKRRVAERAKLVDMHEQRREVLAQVSGQIQARRKEIASLQRDEQRLARIIEGLARIVPKAAPRPRPSERDESPSRPEAPGPRNERTPDASQGNGAFAHLRGHLRLPIRGELVNRFGTPRAEGGATWKGLFIRAASGAEVKSIATGRVVFAEWLRGFGNLVIVDHGASYLSVYGNNESLLKSVGDAVRSGDAIATVGNSGGNPESGLYFEIRYQGQAIDPLKWVSLQ